MSTCDIESGSEQSNTPNDENNTSMQPVDMPCTHNMWDNVRMRKDLLILKCRVCEVVWRVHRPPKCRSFFARQQCLLGSACPFPHIYKTKYVGKRRKGNRRSSQEYEEMTFSSSQAKTHTNMPPRGGGTRVPLEVASVEPRQRRHPQFTTHSDVDGPRAAMTHSVPHSRHADPVGYPMQLSPTTFRNELHGASARLQSDAGVVLGLDIERMTRQERVALQSRLYVLQHQHQHHQTYMSLDIPHHVQRWGSAGLPGFRSSADVLPVDTSIGSPTPTAPPMYAPPHYSQIPGEHHNQLHHHQPLMQWERYPHSPQQWSPGTHRTVHSPIHHHAPHRGGHFY